jgi:hypothetical protein
MGRNTIIAVGNSTQTLTHGLLNGGQAVNVVGVKLESNFFKACQMVDSSKITLLIDGSAITLTNTARAGMFTTITVDTGGTVADGNLVECARQLNLLGDSIGGEYRVAVVYNGIVKAITLLGVTYKIGDLLSLAGNDVPEYPIEWNFQDWRDS